MTDRPILFSAAMIKANLREIEQPGTGKINTRRILHGVNEDGRIYIKRSKTSGHDGLLDVHEACQRGDLPFAKGDRLWAREAWCGCKQMDAIKPSEFSHGEPIGYLADGEIRSKGCLMVAQGKTRPSIFMPRWASRLTLVVTDVQAERLQEISNEGAIAEGIFDIGHGLWDYHEHAEIRFKHPKAAFRELWDSLNAKRGFGWDENPWVIAVTYKPVHCNIDDLATT